MTHMGPMPDHAGDFSEPRDTETHCRKCDGQPVSVLTWDSHCGGYTDYKYMCAACGHVWWIEGIDS